MTPVAYTVLATLPDPATAEEFIAWLRDGHVDAVIAGGAHSAMIVRLDDVDPPDAAAAPGKSAVQVEIRYIFTTRQALDRYLVHTAPGLRADGLARFGPERGVRFERRTGTIA
ncbi:MAG: DUF4286 family protein [Phycisphaeraceae bacterium]|nr:DUF4286 family protein [Phycisphaeraceae bacterium]